MTIIGESWGMTVLVGASVLGTVGIVFLFLTRSPGVPSHSVRCPMTGDMTLVQHVADEECYLTDLVTCRAFAPGQAVTCGMPCLTGGVRTRIADRAEDLVKV